MMIIDFLDERVVVMANHDVYLMPADERGVSLAN